MVEEHADLLPNVSTSDLQSVLGYSKIQVAPRRTKMARRSSEEAHVPRIHPWEGPLLAPRISPMLSIGDIITKAMVCNESIRTGSARGPSKLAVARCGPSVW
jgi:hypothetical protein